MKRRARLSQIQRLLGLLSLSLVILFPSLAEAASLRTQVGARKVGLGQPFEVQVTVVQEDGDPEPGQPELRLNGKARVQGPSVGSQRRVSMKNFSFESESSVVATWTVTPLEIGRLVVGPGSFQIGTKRLQGEQIIVEVVEEEQNSRPRSPFSRFGPRQNPFGDDPFEMLTQRPRTIADLAPLPEEYAVKEAPNQPGFLVAHLEKRHAILGEVLHLVVVAYGAQGNFREVSPNEPSLPDFLSYSVVESSQDEPAYRTEINGSLFIARKLREYIIVPLRTGELTIGGMSAVLQGNGNSYPPQGSPHGFKVTSPQLTLVVEDAPSKGRPPGYVPGDVGDFHLSADISPRELKTGEFAELIVNVSGKGQLPTQVILPEGKDFAWDPPTMRGGPEVQDGELQGTRVLKFPLQIKNPGNISLGELSLPFFDPETRMYRVAKADLGSITVEQSPIPSSAAAPDQSVDAQAIEEGTEGDELSFPPRAQPDAYDLPRRFAPRFITWAFIFGLPVLIFLVGAAQNARNFFSQGTSDAKKNEARAHLSSARNALREKDLRTCLFLCEKALYEALEHATQIKYRAVLRSELGPHLVVAGLSEELATTAQRLLETCERTRYEPESAVPEILLKEAETFTADLQKWEKTRAKSLKKSGASA